MKPEIPCRMKLLPGGAWACETHGVGGGPGEATALCPVAFAALLAVVKEADENDTTNYLLRVQLKALERDHPSWREWRP